MAPDAVAAASSSLPAFHEERSRAVILSWREERVTCCRVAIVPNQRAANRRGLAVAEMVVDDE